MLYYDELTERRRELVLLDVRERVAKGVALLDEYDSGWRLEVDVEKLDIMDERLCILGQTFGDYFEGKDYLGITADYGSGYGFDVYYFFFDPNENDVAVSADVVKDEWLRHL